MRVLAYRRVAERRASASLTEPPSLYSIPFVRVLGLLYFLVSWTKKRGYLRFLNSCIPLIVVTYWNPAFISITISKSCVVESLFLCALRVACAVSFGAERSDAPWILFKNGIVLACTGAFLFFCFSFF